MSDAIIEAVGIEKSYPQSDGTRIQVVGPTNLAVEPGKIIALLGPSGCGKSTLLRMLTGLSQATSGTLSWHGKPLDGQTPNVAIVFQSFALFPWLTVIENVEAPLEARGVNAVERRKRALRTLDTVGLDGFETAYPKELSGGMKQRVGFARALVVEPEVLFMDEPFSALDVLTAETLRTDFLELWGEGKLPIKGVILVTHNIEEAVLMCDRILLFSSNPGRIISDIPVDLKQPRNRIDPQFHDMVEKIYVAMTARKAAPTQFGAVPAATMNTVLPRVSANLMSGLMETLSAAPFNGNADLPVLADELAMESDELLPVAESLQMFRLAEIEGGDIKLTDIGKQFVEMATDDRKKLFARQLLAQVPLATHIRRVLQERANHVAPKSRFLDELEDHMSTEDAEHTLRAVIAWGRFAEVFAYDDDSETFSLENPT